MRLYGLLLALTLALADNDNYVCDQCFEDEVEDEKNHTISGLPEIQCFLYNNLLSCSWSTDSLPEDAQYTASYQFCLESSGHPLYCNLEGSKKLVECQSQLKYQLPHQLAINVSISKNGVQNTVCKYYEELGAIEKLDAPSNITASANSGNLEIQWVGPKSCCSTVNDCFLYELKINNEKKDLEGVLIYKYVNMKPTSHYTIQIRTKHNPTCLENDRWSDWSKAVVIGPEMSISLSASVIICIALILPMILLTILLVCKFQRLTKKLFPSVPNPSKNVLILLEKNDFNQVIPQKQIEEQAEFIEVTGSLPTYF